MEIHFPEYAIFEGKWRSDRLIMSPLQGVMPPSPLGMLAFTQRGRGIGGQRKETEMAQRGKAKPITENDNEENIDTTLLTTAPDDWEFETVAEESPTTVILDEGDQFIGQYIGEDRIEFEAIDQETKEVKTDFFERFVFRCRDNRMYAMNKSYKLEEAMKKVNPQQWVRITLVKNVETKRSLNPMKDFRVEVKRSS